MTPRSLQQETTSLLGGNVSDVAGPRLLGAAGVKLRFRGFGVIGKSCRLSVVVTRKRRSPAKGYVLRGQGQYHTLKR